MFWGTLQNAGRLTLGEELLNKLFLFSLHTKSILVTSQNWSWATDDTWTVSPMPLLLSGTGNITVALLSMQGQRALRFHQKYLNLCSEDEQRSYGFGTTWGWVINDRIFILGWTNPLMIWTTRFSLHFLYSFKVSLRFSPYYKTTSKYVMSTVDLHFYSMYCQKLNMTEISGCP